MKTIILIIFVFAPASFVEAQTRQYSLGGQPFDGGKFGARYKLQSGDFWVVGDLLILKDGISMPDNPPIVEPPDPQTGPSNEAVRVRSAADKLLDKQYDQTTILIRAVIATMLDEINILRKTAGLQPRTANDVKTAIKNKINSGAAD